MSTNSILSEIRAEILRLKLEVYDEAHQFDIGARCSLTYLDSFLDTLQEPSLSSDAEKAAEKYTSENYYELLAPGDLANAFIAGAEWQASQMPMPEDTVLFQKGVAEGRRLEREDMMKDAEKDLGWISVKDRLPEENKWVFVCVDMQGVPQCVGLGYLKDGEWCDDENDNGFCVDYWMPIPELPKEEE